MIDIRSVTAVIAQRQTDATKNNTLLQQITLAVVQLVLRALNDVSVSSVIAKGERALNSYNKRVCSSRLVI